MARAAARGAKGRGRKPAPAPAPEPELSSESEELVMHGDDAESTDLESIEDAVYDIDGASGDDSEEEELEEDARYAALAKQVKTLGAKLRIQQGEGEEDEESEEETAKKPAGDERWGSKRAYYDADNIDLEGSEDEEAAKDEEEEALRLQQAALAGLGPEDYGIAGGEESGSEDGEEGVTDDEAADAQETVEFVPRDLAGLSAAERGAAAARAAPELAGLLGELRGSLAELRHRVGPLLAEVRGGELATAEGLSYLEAKHLLLLQYCTCIVFYLLLKAEGRQVAGHPVVARLVELRTWLDKARPIDKRLKSQLDRLLAAAGAAGAAASGTAGPRPGALVLGDGDEQEAGVQAMLDEAAAEDADTEAVLAAQRRGGPGGVYRPPRLNPVSMEAEEGRAERRAGRAVTHAAARAGRSDLLSELARELEGAPEEVRALAPGADTAAAARQRHRLASRAAVEEELMVRVPLGRAEIKAQRAARRAGMAGGALLDDFREDVAAVLDGPGLDSGFARHRLGQRWGGDAPGTKAAARSGDADLPARDPLAQRRAAFDSVAAKRAQRDAPVHGDDDEPARVEDEFYAAVKSAKDKSKRARKDAYSFPETNVPLEEPSAPGARKISAAIEKNRGLTPHRRKDIKNPRKKNRMKFDQATVRRKGQVQAVREGGAGHYGGEATGVKSHISKSVRF